MFLPKTTLPVVVAALLLCLAPTQSQAFGTAEIVAVDGQIEVASNGRGYTELARRGDIRVTTRLRLRMNPPHKVTGYRAGFRILYGSRRAIATFSYSGPSTHSFPEAERPGILDARVRLTILAASIAGPAIEVCNDKAADLRRAGQTNAQIFGRDRTASLLIRPDSYLASTASDGYRKAEPGIDRMIGIICRRGRTTSTSDRHPPPSSGELEIRSAFVQAQPLVRRGERCRVALQVSINANLAGATVEYTINTERGTKSRVFRTRTDGYGRATSSHVLEPRSQSGPNSGYFIVKPAGATPLFSSNQARYSFVCPSVDLKVQPERPKLVLPPNKRRGLPPLPRN